MAEVGSAAEEGSVAEVGSAGSSAVDIWYDEKKNEKNAGDEVRWVRLTVSSEVAAGIGQRRDANDAKISCPATQRYTGSERE